MKPPASVSQSDVDALEAALVQAGTTIEHILIFGPSAVAAHLSDWLASKSGVQVHDAHGIIDANELGSFISGFEPGDIVLVTEIDSKLTLLAALDNEIYTGYELGREFTIAISPVTLVCSSSLPNRVDHQIRARFGYVIDLIKNRSADDDAAEPSAKSEEAAVWIAACAVLRVPATASWVEISAARNRLAKKYHPDTVAGRGPEFHDMADRLMGEINAAFAVLKKLSH